MTDKINKKEKKSLNEDVEKAKKLRSEKVAKETKKLDESDSDKGVDKQKSAKQINKTLKTINRWKMLRLASTQKKKKLLTAAEEAYSDSNTVIRNIGYAKFVVNKTKRLKALGKTQSEIIEAIVDLKESIEKDDKKAKEKALKKNARKEKAAVFFLDSKFTGLTAKEILKKVNAITSAGAIKPSVQERTKQKLTKKADAATLKAAGITDKNALVTSLDDYEKVHKEFKDSEVLLVMSSNKPMKVSLNSDVANSEKIFEQNEQIYNHLVKIGEYDVAEYIHNLMSSNTVDFKNVSEIRDHTSEVKKLSAANTDVAKALDELNNNLRPKQKTDIEPIQDVLKQQVTIEQSNGDTEAKPEQATSFLSKVLGLLFGAGITKLLLGRSVYALGVGLLRASLGWLKNSLSGWVARTALGAFAGTKKLLQAGITKATKLATSASKLTAAFLTKHLAPLKDKLKIMMSNFDKVKVFLEGKFGKFASFVSDKAKDVLNKGKDVAKKVSDGAKLAWGASSGWVKSKLPSAKKVSSAADLTKKGTKTLSKAAGAGSGIISKLKPLLKMLKPIPYVGQAIMAASAAYYAYDGYTNADKIYGIPQDQLSTRAKLFAGLGAAIEDLVWPIPVDREFIANWAMKLTGSPLLKDGDPEDIHSAEWSDAKTKRKSVSGYDGGWKAAGAKAAGSLLTVSSSGVKGETEGFSPSATSGISIMSGSSMTPTNSGDNTVADFSTGAGRTSVEDGILHFSEKGLSLDGIATGTKDRFLNMAQEFYEITGKKLQVNSANRSFEKQAQLYRTMKPGYAAPPGASMHNYGYAIDIQSVHANKLDSLGLLKKYKFWRPIKAKEAWHVEDATIDRAKVRAIGMAMYNKGQTPAKVQSSEAKGESEGALTLTPENKKNESPSLTSSSKGVDPQVQAVQTSPENKKKNPQEKQLTTPENTRKPAALNQVAIKEIGELSIKKNTNSGEVQELRNEIREIKNNTSKTSTPNEEVSAKQGGSTFSLNNPEYALSFK